MRSLLPTALITVTFGALAASLVVLWRFEPIDTQSWLIGCALSAATGVLALILKRLFSGPELTGAAALKAVLAAQGMAFFVRLLAVGVGAVAIKQAALSPFSFVIAFFVVSLAQQALETRALLALAKPRASSEVPS